jgi:YegS/Rv2252/BmrU family lipid kinase
VGEVNRRVCLIYNPAAGGGRARKVLPAIEAALHREDLTFRSTATTSLDHAETLAGEAVAEGEVVATLGGDGLVGRVAHVLREKPDALLAILPGGRGNDFARVLGIPTDPDEAAHVVAAGKVRALDVGDVGGKTFVGIASCGFDSDANRIANEAPSRLGNLVYAYGALRALVSWTPAGFELELDGEPLRYSGWSAVAANSSAYGGGMFVAPDAELDDGMLEIVITRESGKLHFLRSLPKVFKGTHVDDPHVEVHRAREVKISANRPFALYADGDPIADLPATVRAVPEAVRVLVPA